MRPAPIILESAKKLRNLTHGIISQLSTSKLYCFYAFHGILSPLKNFKEFYYLEVLLLWT